MDKDFYGEDYYLHGIETGLSNYQNYKWIPELTLPLAMTIIDLLDIRRTDTILEVGCAFGYLVKAFRLLHRQAWGVDISRYAIKNADRDVKKYCCLSLENKRLPHSFDVCIAKDVFEHTPLMELANILKSIPSRKLFVVVPLGKNGIYEAPANNMDKSHVICEGLDWWIRTFEEALWSLTWSTYRVDGIKDPYYKKYPKSHGFFLIEKGN